MKQKSPEEHFAQLATLVQLEEAEEIESFHREFVQLSPEEREFTGKSLLHLVVHDLSYSPAGHILLTLIRADRSPLPFYTLDSGDLVTLSREHPSMGHFPGTVFERDEASITVAFNKLFPDWVHTEFLALNRTTNRATFQHMYEALDNVGSARHGRLAYLKKLTFGQKVPQTRDPEAVQFFDEGLNEPQRKTVEKALCALDIALIHGPPGTGKTRVLAEIICQAHKREEYIFASAPSNIACDNLLERLVQAKLPVVRIGHPARILNHLRDYTLDHQLVLHPYAKLVEKLEREMDELKKRWHRNREKGRVSRDLKEEFQEELGRLKTEHKTLSKQLFDHVLKSARVVVGTHVSAASNLFGENLFDLVVLDEASQAIEPLSWVSLCRTKRVVVAGDHWQLPPTVRSQEAERKGLAVSLFERLIEVLPEEAKSLLTIQYRMHELIMGFSSSQFYDNLLIADESVKAHTLADLSHVRDTEETREAFVFIDTAGAGFEEALEPGSQSRFNQREAELAIRQLQRLLECGVKDEEIALISPYNAQVRFLESRLRDKNVEIGSVDGFQGREKEAVIVSLVRSNLEGELGFLVDRRRMNVALTRARRKLVVIGDSATLSSIPFYRAFFEYAESISAYRSAWEYLE